MAEEKLLTVREAASILAVSEKEIMDLAESGKLPAYKVGGVFLRFKKDQIDEFKKSLRPHTYKIEAEGRYSARERIDDFFYFNDFYILAGLMILLILFIALRGY
jgi:excisionase family DNA binding protein